MVHTCHPSIEEGRQEDHFEASLVYSVFQASLSKIPVSKTKTTSKTERNKGAETYAF